MKRPPSWAERLLRALLEARNRDAIAGDLREEYEERESGRGWYARQVLSFVDGRSLLRLPFALLPGSVVWALVAGLAQWVILYLLARAEGITAEWAFGIVAAALAVGSAAAVARSASSGAGARLVLSVAVLWFLPVAGAAFAILRASPFTPVPGVALFFVCVPAAGIHAAWRSGKAGVGIAASLATGTLTALLTMGSAYALDLPHPPLVSALFVPGFAAILGAVAAPFGSRFGTGFEFQGLDLCRALQG